MKTDTDHAAKRNLYKTARLNGRPVALVAFYVDGEGPHNVRWLISFTLGGPTQVALEAELTDFCL